MTHEHPCSKCGTKCHSNYVCISCMEPQARQDLFEEQAERLIGSRLYMRDKFAMAALPALVSEGMRGGEVTEKNARITCEQAYELADAMIVARERKTE